MLAIFPVSLSISTSVGQDFSLTIDAYSYKVRAIRYNKRGLDQMY